ncbi:cation transporter [Legionella israelensis]|uniref:cation transporter n=1 Tax=Legionella israelensis TaxID=454 RepID=UPI00117D8F44|nr:cation transporter [Legionella israelensis]QDP71399.1 cation transporter [Legionella israelensis]
MTDCGCQQVATTKSERKTLTIALILNALMFVVGLTAGIIAQSTALIADSLDMLADSFAYSLGLLAVGRTAKLKKIIAVTSGGLLCFLGLGVLFEVGRRAWFGSSPESSLMIGVACLSLIINTIVLKLLKKFRNGEVHLRATWIFTRADVVANIGVIFSGILVLLTKSRYPDLIVGFAIGLYVIKEALEIFKESLKT